MTDYSQYDPPDPATLGADKPKVRELVGFVVACVGARKDTAVVDKQEQDVVKLDRLVVITANKTAPAGIEGVSYPDYIIWQKRFQWQLEAADKPVVIGRIVRPEQAFELEIIPNDKKAAVVELMEANDWLPKSRTSYRPAQVQQTRDDGGDSF